MVIKRAVDDRKGVIGASSIGAMLGLSQWRNATPYSVWNEAISGVKPERTQAELSRFALGHKLEPFIADLAKECYPIEGYYSWGETGETPPAWQCEREGMGFLICHPDRIAVVRDGDELKVVPVEIKTSSTRMDSLWGAEESDEIPYEYLLQVYGYFLTEVGSGLSQPEGVTLEPCKEVWLFRWSDNRLTRYVIKRPDEEALADIAKRVKETWDSWQRGEVPPPTTFEEAKAIFPPFEGRVEATQEILQKLSALSSLLSEEEEKRKEKDDLKKEIIEFLAGASTLTYDGEVLCTYKEQSTNRFDAKAFRSANPELAKEFYKKSMSRVLRLKGGKDGE